MLFFLYCPKAPGSQVNLYNNKQSEGIDVQIKEIPEWFKSRSYIMESCRTGLIGKAYVLVFGIKHRKNQRLVFTSEICNRGPWTHPSRFDRMTVCSTFRRWRCPPNPTSLHRFAQATNGRLATIQRPNCISSGDSICEQRENWDFCFPVWLQSHFTQLSYIFFFLLSHFFYLLLAFGKYFNHCILFSERFQITRPGGYSIHHASNVRPSVGSSFTPLLLSYPRTFHLPGLLETHRNFSHS